MIRRTILLVCVPAIWLCLNSCQRLRDVQPFSSAKGAGIPTQTAEFLDAVPAEYGDLIGVTSGADYPAWTQAWFMKPDKSIIVLWINPRSGQIFERMLVIPRR